MHTYIEKIFIAQYQEMKYQGAMHWQQEVTKKECCSFKHVSICLNRRKCAEYCLVRLGVKLCQKQRHCL